MGKSGKVLFQDEPEEVCKPRKLKAPRLFGDEPEEEKPASSTSTTRLESATSRPLPPFRPQPTLFGDEGDEVPQAGSAPQVEDAASDDDEEAPQPATLNLDWSAMKLFSHASFLQKQVSQSKPEQKKRCYGNSKRAEKAASKVRVSSTSFQQVALTPGRLETLVAKGECKCA